MNKMMFQKKEKQLMKFIQNFKINITEDDMFNLLKINELLKKAAYAAFFIAGVLGSKCAL